MSGAQLVRSKVERANGVTRAFTFSQKSEVLQIWWCAQLAPVMIPYQKKKEKNGSGGDKTMCTEWVY